MENPTACYKFWTFSAKFFWFSIFPSVHSTAGLAPPALVVPEAPIGGANVAPAPRIRCTTLCTVLDHDPPPKYQQRRKATIANTSPLSLLSQTL